MSRAFFKPHFRLPSRPVRDAISQTEFAYPFAHQWIALIIPLTKGGGSAKISPVARVLPKATSRSNRVGGYAKGNRPSPGPAGHRPPQSEGEIMAQIYRPPKLTFGPDGKRRPVVDAKGKPVRHEHFYARIVQHDGTRKTCRLPARTEAEARQQANMLEVRQIEIKSGIRPPPTPAERAAARPVADVLDEFLDWGRACGGRGGRPWSPIHDRDKTAWLDYWVKALALHFLADVAGCLPAVEKTLRALAKTGRRGKPLSGKSLNNATEALSSFFAFCAHPSRRYLERNPLDGITRRDGSPKSIRRAPTPEELRAVLAAASPAFALTIKTASCTGFRRGELRSLTADHLTMTPTGPALRLDAAADKGRRERLQPIPAWLYEELAEHAKAGTAAAEYRRHYKRKDARPGKIPPRPLLFTPNHTARSLLEAADKAGVARVNELGRLDFHALRVGFINFLLESGADLKTCQTLARHTAASLTLNVYGRSKADRLASAAEHVGGVVAALAPS